MEDGELQEIPSLITGKIERIFNGDTPTSEVIMLVTMLSEISALTNNSVLYDTFMENSNIHWKTKAQLKLRLAEAVYESPCNKKIDVSYSVVYEIFVHY